ncbi:MAG: hypothetical protein HZC28_18555 [Spirochaetes bacterium]|nr:hypothetical protein [Spirochaetota bacterium]
MALTETTQREFAQRILDVVNANSDKLSQAGVDTRAKQTALKDALTNAFSLEEAQLRAAAEAKKATTATTAATAAVYKKASDIVELITGALGKDDPLVKKIKAMRPAISNVKARGARKAK